MQHTETMGRHRANDRALRKPGGAEFSRSWMPDHCSRAGRLDPRRWQSRAARGLSWDADGDGRSRTHRT